MDLEVNAETDVLRLPLRDAASGDVAMVRSSRLLMWLGIADVHTTVFCDAC